MGILTPCTSETLENFSSKWDILITSRGETHVNFIGIGPVVSTPINS